MIYHTVLDSVDLLVEEGLCVGIWWRRVLWQFSYLASNLSYLALIVSIFSSIYSGCY